MSNLNRMKLIRKSRSSNLKQKCLAFLIFRLWILCQMQVVLSLSKKVQTKT